MAGVTGVMVRVANRLLRLPGLLRDRIDLVQKARQCRLATGAVLYPSSRISNARSPDAILIGANSRIHARLQTFGHHGSIVIGEDCFISEDTTIWSAAGVTIGDRVLVSHRVDIHDNNSHSLSASERHDHLNAIFGGAGHSAPLRNITAAPVVIEDDAWIGFGAAILKGVRIGRGAVVGAHSVVTRDVEPYAIVAGNPARVVGRAAP